MPDLQGIQTWNKKKDREARLKFLLVEAVLRLQSELSWSDFGLNAAASVRSMPPVLSESWHRSLSPGPRKKYKTSKDAPAKRRFPPSKSGKRGEKESDKVHLKSKHSTSKSEPKI